VLNLDAIEKCGLSLTESFGRDYQLSNSAAEVTEMNKHFLSTIAIVAIVLSIANSVMLVRQNAGAARLAALSIPQLINYQGRLTDAAGNPLTGSYNMTFCLYEAATGGTSPWCENQVVTVTYGVFNALLGSVTPIPATAFGSTNLYLGVRVGSDSEMTPRRRVVSAGYAYRAEDAAQAVHATYADQATNADTLDSLHASDFVRPGQAIPSGAIILWDGASCPEGWTPVEALVDKFPMGGTTYGTTGGSTTHSHSGTTGGMVGGSSIWFGGHDDLAQVNSHVHDFATAPASSLPPYITVVFCRKN
jgi:hypothetical protein